MKLQEINISEAPTERKKVQNLGLTKAWKNNNISETKQKLEKGRNLISTKTCKNYIWETSEP